MLVEIPLTHFSKRSVEMSKVGNPSGGHYQLKEQDLVKRVSLHKTMPKNYLLATFLLHLLQLTTISTLISQRLSWCLQMCNLQPGAKNSTRRGLPSRKIERKQNCNGFLQ